MTNPRSGETSETQKIDGAFVGAVLDPFAGQPEFNCGGTNCLAIAPQDCDLCDLESGELLLIPVSHSAEFARP